MIDDDDGIGGVSIALVVTELALEVALENGAADPCLSHHLAELHEIVLLKERGDPRQRGNGNLDDIYRTSAACDIVDDLTHKQIHEGAIAEIRGKEVLEGHSSWDALWLLPHEAKVSKLLRIQLQSLHDIVLRRFRIVRSPIQI